MLLHRFALAVGVAILVGSVLAACGGDSGSPPDLAGTNWQLVSLGDTPTIAEATPKLAFAAGGAFSGTTGCNDIDGTWEVDDDDDDLDLTVGRTTLMACSDEIMAQETAFVKALNDTESARIKDQKLELRDDDDKVIATFDPLKAAELVGPTWTVNGFNNGANGVVSPSGETPMTAIFTADGQVSGSSGCNQYHASYTVDGNKISIGQIASTMMACDDAIMTQEQQFQTALGQAATFEIGISGLTLHSADGAAQVIFTAGP